MGFNTVNLNALQKQFFNLLDAFFERATGFKYYDFAPLDGFEAAMRQNKRLPTLEGQNAYVWVHEQLNKFYGEHSLDLFRASKTIGGMKLVLGGSSRFTITHLDAVRKMLLYTDTVLIPDPVLPWIEQDRKEEKFPFILFLWSVFTLLHLKPLVDAQLAYPAVIVFPSFEKGLEANDRETIEGIYTLTRHFVSHYTNKDFSSHEELVKYVRKNEADFLTCVEDKSLLVAPGGEIGEPLKKTIEQAREEVNTWHAPNYASQVRAMPDGIFVLYGLYQRLGPQFHLLENAAELTSQPMLCIPQQEYYYSLCTRMFSGRLVDGSLMDAKTVAILRSLNEPSLRWLGNVPIAALAKMREQNENEDFRKALEGCTKQLNDASLDNLNRVAAEVGRGIASLLMAHQKRLHEIEEQYSTLHKQTAVGAWLTLAATILPALAPIAGSAVAPLALATKYGFDKVKEHQDRSKAAHSLIGILASAKRMG